MATTFSTSGQADHFDSGVIARHVADDLASIFGADRRADTAGVETVRVDGGRVREPRHRPLMALVGVGALAAMVGGGLLVGNEATGGAAPASPVERTRMASPAPAPAQPVVALSAAALPAPVETIRDAPEVSASAEMPTPAVARRTPPREAAIEDRSLAADTSVPAPTRFFYPAADQPARTVVAPAPRLTCADRGDCPENALTAADRRVAIAYDAAIGAGVRNRDLRDYRAEWVRARSRAAGDPQGALRIYGMVAADLDTLTQDAASRPDPAWR